MNIIGLKTRDTRSFGNYRESRHVDYESPTNRDDAIYNGFEGRSSTNANESYSDITQKVRVDVPTYDGKIDATTFSNWIVAMKDYFDWYEMSDIEWVRLA